LIEGIKCELREATTARAELLVYVTLSDAHYGGQPPQLSGHVRGPHCELAQTLPCDFELQAVVGERLLLLAGLSDPCYWTTQLPMLYEIAVDLRVGEKLVSSHTEKIGLTRPPTNTVDELGLN